MAAEEGTEKDIFKVRAKPEFSSRASRSFPLPIIALCIVFYCALVAFVC